MSGDSVRNSSPNRDSISARYLELEAKMRVCDLLVGDECICFIRGFSGMIMGFAKFSVVNKLVAVNDSMQRR